MLEVLMPARRSRPESAAQESDRDFHEDRPGHLAALDALTVPQLNEVIQEAKRLKDAKLESARADFMSRVKAESEQLGLDLGALFQPPAPKRGRKPGSGQGKGNVAAKYRGPNGEEWSGRGRAPKWMQVALAEGKDRGEFLIDKPDAAE
jgi:DNA-binding protein H-NS